MKEPTSDFAHLWNDLPNKILEIAKSLKDKDLYFGCYLYWDKQSEKNVTIQAYKWGLGGRMFNPYENDADAFKVLEALIKFVCEHKHWMSVDIFGPFAIEITGVLSKQFEGKTLREAICKAYLSLIQQEEG